VLQAGYATTGLKVSSLTTTGPKYTHYTRQHGERTVHQEASNIQKQYQHVTARKI